MPYIPQDERQELKDWLLPFVNEGAVPKLSAGQINYLMTKLVIEWIGEPSYQKIAIMTGVLENVKQELYRRLAGPYEDSKIAENGDVYNV
jgi:hypothetical protein